MIRLDNGGMEWELLVPARSVDSFGRLGDEARALVWLLHREDQMKLFGFPDEASRAVFIELMGVDGIGPRQAIKILGGIGADDLERALEAEDMARLESIPGLGKKTAQKLVFSLKGKLPGNFRADTSARASPDDDMVRALVDLGYDRKRAQDAVLKVGAGADLPAGAQEREREIFRRAIVEMSAT